MAVFRVAKNDNYTTMSNYHLRDKELSLKAKGLLSFMLSLPDDWDYSIEGLASLNKESSKTIKVILDELRENNYLEVNKIRNEKGQYEYEYLIYEKPYTQKPGVDEPGVDSPPVESYRQLNTKELNTEKQITNKQNTKKIHISSAGASDICKKAAPDDLYSYVEEAFGRTINGIEYEIISNWEDTELTRYAIKQAVLNGAKGFKYIERILADYKKENITTLEQAKKRDEEYQSRRNKYNKNEVKEEDVSERARRILGDI